MDTKRLDYIGYEHVIHFTDTDFSAFIAIHSTKLGPALGGCRLLRYESDKAALEDVLRLAKGMSYKNALAGLNHGGGKCVVNAAWPNPEIMRKVGEAVEYLGGLYITAEDVGTTVADMAFASEKTKHIASIGQAGDPSPWTAMGLHECIHTASSYSICKHTPAVYIKGLGKVGMDLAERLDNDGCKLFVADIDEDRVQYAIWKFGVTRYQDEHASEVDVYAPCAMGNVITAVNVDTIRFPIICGSANNQLESDDLAEVLAKNNVLYCPDFLVNAGGVIAASYDVEDDYDYDNDMVADMVCERGMLLDMVFEISNMMKVTPLKAALVLAEMRLK